MAAEEEDFLILRRQKQTEKEILSAEKDYLEVRLSTIKEHLNRTRASDK